MDMAEVSERGYRMLGEAAFGDRMKSIAMLEEIGSSVDQFVMFGLCCGLAEGVRVVLEGVGGQPAPGSHVGLVMPPGAERRHPERAFAARFLTAWMNGDQAMCRALFFATFQAPGPFGHADNVVALLDLCGEMIRDVERIKKDREGGA